jgi:FlaA1/EpsC-like NDP-sugar epimerase
MQKEDAQSTGSSPWLRFFYKVEVVFDAALYREHIVDRTILITGAGGWIGSALCASLALRGAKHLILLDLAEGALYEAHRELAQRSRVRITAVLGSVCDTVCLRDVISRYRPQVIYHTAAYKHVPLAEENPFAVLRNNALGTATLAQTAADFNVPQFIMVSTDKAVEPAGIMGVSKRIGELAIFRYNRGGSMRAVRLGNVFGSPGSVAPLFRMQIERGGPLTLTHPEARRYFLTIGEATEYLQAALAVPRSSDLLVPNLGAALRVADLARFMVGDRDVPIVFDGLRPGDKIEEALLAANESLREQVAGGLDAIESPRPMPQEVDNALVALEEAIDLRDLDMLLTTVQRLVPDYTPSSLLREQLGVNKEALR